MFVTTLCVGGLQLYHSHTRHWPRAVGGRAPAAAALLRLLLRRRDAVVLFARRVLLLVALSEGSHWRSEVQDTARQFAAQEYVCLCVCVLCL